MTSKAAPFCRCRWSSLTTVKSEIASPFCCLCEQSEAVSYSHRVREEIASPNEKARLAMTAQKAKSETASETILRPRSDSPWAKSETASQTILRARSDTPLSEQKGETASETKRRPRSDKRKGAKNELAVTQEKGEAMTSQ